MTRPLLPILCYHHVGVRVEPHGHRRLWVSSARFREHLGMLKSEGYRALTLHDCVPFFSGAAPVPAKAVVLTFDDAYVNFFDFALPALVEFGFTGTVFVPTGHVGGVSRWDRGYESPVMSWGQLRQVRAAGIECASHTVSHPRLTRIARDDARQELTASRAALEDALGAPVKSIAYPFGDVNRSVEQLTAEAGYQIGCTIVRGNRHNLRKPLLLKRVPVAEFTSGEHLAYRLRPVYEWTSRFKRLGDWLRRRDAGVPAA